MRHSRSSGRRVGGLVALTAAAACSLGTMTALAPAAAAAPAPAPASGQPATTVAGQPELGGTCTAADLGTRYPFIKSTQIVPTITHFKGWYITDGATGTQTVQTSTQSVVTVSVGLDLSIKGAFDLATLAKVEASAGLSVKMEASTTSSESKSITWDFRKPGYYALYEGTRKVTGQYGSLNCNRVDTGNGTFATKWVEGPGGGSYTTYTTLEEGAVRCEDAVPASSIMRKAQDILGCGAATLRTERAPAADGAATAAAPAKTAAQQDWPGFPGTTAPPGFTCDAASYKIGTPDRALFWSAPGFLDLSNSVQLRPAAAQTWPAGQDQWQLCSGPAENGIAEQILINRSNNKCLAIAAPTAADEGAILQQADCKVDDLQRFYVYRDVPGSDKIGVQNKYTGYMIGHDRKADGQPLHQYSMGKPDGTGTYVLVKA
ncbi:RICIN domain-containing protein [Kitasatospora sp. NPDC086801]|uniref:RICIN domain-containing protein n=1 Tax=Kitasatospora sp. NPDC086801 TaxID=3364066 RepID=UPI00381B7B51